MATARNSLAGSGTSGATGTAFAAAGYTGSNVTNTEEFTGETTVANVKTFSTS